MSLLGIRFNVEREGFGREIRGSWDRLRACQFCQGQSPDDLIIFEYDFEVEEYIHDATNLVGDIAAQGRALHVSQSFSGPPQSSGIVISQVPCPQALALQVQEAIDRAVETILCESPISEPTIH